jgi:Taurine catabolism dioxygenase TauD, TfdA family
MSAAFDGLSDRMQQYVSGLEALHDFKPFRDLFDDSEGDRQNVLRWEAIYPPMTHPVVRVHPVTARKVLFVNPQRPKGRPAFSAGISAELAARGTSTSEPLVQCGLDSMPGQARESKSGHFWSSDGTEPARGRPGRSIGRNLPMADKEMIAATLAAGVLAAAPPVLDPMAAAKEAASLYFELLHQLEHEAQARKA